LLAPLPLGLTADIENAADTPRFSRPTSKIAEDVTVITAAQIAELNAHTLAEVLQTIPGVQLSQIQTPGSWTDFNIHGADVNLSHVLVLIDGVKVNNLTQGAADPGLIPAQLIERIEIVKGASASSWGQALAGVVNVITKSPDRERSIGGLASASLGERSTNNVQGEASGTIKNFGYYLAGGNLHSSGLVPNNGINFNHGYGKLTFELPNRGLLTYGLLYREASRGLDENALVHDNAFDRTLYTFLNLNYPVAERLTLDFQGKYTRNTPTTKLNDNIDGIVTPFQEWHSREITRGGSAKLTWGDRQNNLVGGMEYEHGDSFEQNALTPDEPPSHDRRKDSYATFANGTLSLGSLTVLPGIRVDRTGLGNDCLSYNLGATYKLTDKTLLRAYFANGFGLPLLAFDHGAQRVWSVQTGVETEAVPFVWLKGTLFYNNIWNVTVEDYDLNSTGYSSREQIKQGFELEAKTTPFYGLSLSSGYTFLAARDKETGKQLISVPSNLVKAALSYYEKRIGFKGVLTANYVNWHAQPERKARYSAVIVDLHLTQRLFPGRELSPEFFFSARNLFNGAQYQNDSDYSTYKNPSRWLEGGVRFKF
jgi:vitamin B12 transporter